jgi:hypothetical protein
VPLSLLLSGSLRQELLKVMATQGIWLIRCRSRFDRMLVSPTMRVEGWAMNAGSQLFGGAIADMRGAGRALSNQVSKRVLTDFHKVPHRVSPRSSKKAAARHARTRPPISGADADKVFSVNLCVELCETL